MKIPCIYKSIKCFIFFHKQNSIYKIIKATATTRAAVVQNILIKLEN